MNANPTCIILHILVLMFAFRIGYAQEKKIVLLDSINLLAGQRSLAEDKIEVWYNAAQALHRSDPEVSLAISKWMIHAAKQPKYNFGLGQGYEQMGNSYYYRRNVDSSVWAYGTALRFYKTVNDAKKISSLYNYLVLAFRLAGNSDSSYYYVAKELAQAKLSKDSSALATALHDEAYRLTEQNQLSKSISTFFEALKYAKPTDYLIRININNGIGDTYRIMGNDSASLPFFMASKEIGLQAAVSKLQKAGLLAVACNRISSAYLEMSKLKEASVAIKEQMAQAKQSDDIEHEYRALLNYGIYYSKTKQYDSAEVAFKVCLKIQKQVGRKRSVGVIHYNIAGLYNEWKKFGHALAHADSAEKIFIALNNPSWLSENYYTYAEALSGLGRYEEAYKKMDQYVLTNGELMTKDNNQKIAEMQAAYDVEKKDAAIVVLNQENELKNSQRNFFIVVAASLLATALLVVYLYKQKQKSNMLLSEKNTLIEKSLHERETLLKEIHHRVKNNLQIISSLLSLQSKSTSDVATQGAISESRNRVKSMSLIHEQLYQEDTISGVEMKDYITRLVGSLTSSYGLDTEKVEVKIEADDILLDVDSAIPLGLIINELVSNAMKYAFPEQKAGTILISLRSLMEELRLVVQDNGVGMEDSKKSHHSFGLSMVNSLMRKLKAEMSIVSNAGTSVELIIKDFKKVTFG